MRVLLILTLLLASGAALADEAVAARPATDSVPTIAIDDFFRHSQFDDIKISPTGEYLAASAKIAEDTGALVVLRRSDMQRMGVFRLAGRSFVSSFTWVNPERLLLSVAQADGSRSNPSATGEVFGMDADGKNQDILLSPFVPSRGGRVEGGFLVDSLIDDDDFVLVTVGGVGAGRGIGFPTLERMNVRTGARTLIARAPIANASFLADAERNARLAWGSDERNRQTVFHRAPSSDKWVAIHEEGESGITWTPRFIYPDGRHALIEKAMPEGPNGLFRYAMDSGESTQLVRDKTVDPWFIAYELDGSKPVAVAFMDGMPKLSLLEPDSALVKAWAQVLRGVSGMFALPTSQTQDQKLIAFRLVSDGQPTEFYLFDSDSKKLSYLASSRRWIKPEQMGTIEPVSFASRDGKTIHGYLTLPNGSDGKNLPLIVNPHGGPIGPFDSWGFNPETQLFANRGYATLQVNFRGSGNYGMAFMRGGYRQWGDGMIDDISDGVRWAIQQGIADPQRICIYGASYGAYASMMSTIRDPSLYRCAVGYVGVYDLGLMFTVGDIPDTDMGKNYLREALGTGAEFLARISPASRVTEIKVPVFLITGNEDKRTPPEQSRRLRAALTEAGNPPQWMERDFEGHGFFKLENNRALYTEMLAFFDTHIGPAAATEVASAESVSAP